MALPSDRELVNFSEDHELNNVLAKHGKSQSAANRKVLCEIGKECKEKLGKRVLTQDELGDFLKNNLTRLEDK